MSRQRHVKISKFLSLVLRHRPEHIGIDLDAAGWVGVDDLLDGLRRHQLPLTLEELQAVVAENDKQRFAFSEDGMRIRASQGHSVDVELGYEPGEPPEILYHGTARDDLAAILSQGLLRGSSHHVHLSLDASTAVKVGRRHGEPVVLQVEAGRMHREGHTFFLSENGVWLTEQVPPEYLKPLGEVSGNT